MIDDLPERSGEWWARRRERQAVRDAAHVDDYPPLLSEYLRDDPGHPLGPAMPSGSPLRQDGDSHHEAWARVVRHDPCVYCGASGQAFCGVPLSTLEHIDPKRRGAHAFQGGAHGWLNYSGACERCNGAKGDRRMLVWMLARRGGRVSRRIAA